MAKRKMTAFDADLAGEMKDPAYAAEFNATLKRIRSTDDAVRAIDAARVKTNMTKAELARAIDANPDVVRRLLTRKSSNPTIATFVKLVSALGLELLLVPAGASAVVASRGGAARPSAKKT